MICSPTPLHVMATVPSSRWMTATVFAPLPNGPVLGSEPAITPVFVPLPSHDPLLGLTSTRVPSLGPPNGVTSSLIADRAAYRLASLLLLPFRRF
ncbi:hypothetical protein NL676_038464 [Syzygium grande]|nr:hypothetical protein NL676_038464 [Syzygium grande]